MSKPHSLASVVRSAKVRTYLNFKVSDGQNPLVQFHGKFWGKSMEEEAEQQKAQTQADQDKYEAMEEDQDQGKGKAMDEDGMDEGEVTDEDDDVDILPGCYILDISINGITPKRLWIRADYIRIYDFFQAYYDEYTKPMDRAPSAVLTGQPGIGKSFWIYYAACRRLAETKSLIWSYQAEYYLFVEDGVYKLPTGEWEHDNFTCIIWTLVDSDQSRDGVPTDLVPHGTHLFVMYVTYPVSKRWSRMHKTTREVVVIMNPWGRKEIQQAAHLSPLKGITRTHVNEIFNQLGPVAHLCIDQTSYQLALYRDQLDKAISKITTDDIRKLTDEASGLTMDAVSQKVCLLSRQQRNAVHSQAVVAPITDCIKSRLSNRFRNLERAEQIRLYRLFEKVLGLRRMAGIFYEAIAQSRLQNGMTLELVPMVKMEKRKGSKTWVRWYSSHNPSLGQQLPVKIQPKQTLEYTDDGLQSIKPAVFYVPALNNQTAFGSFILLDDLLYIFQMTTASSDDINQGLIAAAKSYSFPPMENWRFVFIIPPNLTLSVPQPWKLTLRSLSPYSAVADEWTGNRDSTAILQCKCW